MTDPRLPHDATLFARARLGFEPDRFQKQVLDATAERGILNCTRQWGKTSVCAVKALHRAWYEPKSLVLVASPSARQSAIFLDKVRGFLLRLGADMTGDGDNEISVLLPNGSRIVGLPGRADTIRGFSNPSMVLFDEASRVPDVVYEAVLPALATGDGALWLLSTPAGKCGFFWREWQSGGDDWKRIAVPAAECPRIKPRFLEAERRRKSDRIFRQEYCCEFLDAQGALFRDNEVEASIDEEIPVLFDGAAVSPMLLARHPRYYVGVDLGQSQDYSAITVIEKNEIVHRERDPRTYQFRRETRFLLRYAERVPLGAAYSHVAECVRDLVSREPVRGNCTVIVDGTGVGAPVVELLRKGKLGCRVMPVVITAGTGETSDGVQYGVPKKDLIGGLQTAFESGGLRIAAGLGSLEELREELRGMRVRRRGNGYEQYTGIGHDDLVLALALAWWRARTEGAA